MREIKLWTTWSIDIVIDWASEIVLAETEKEIQEFIEWLTGFEYFELNIDKINWDKNFRLRSINNK